MKVFNLKIKLLVLGLLGALTMQADSLSQMEPVSSSADAQSLAAPANDAAATSESAFRRISDLLKSSENYNPESVSTIKLLIPSITESEKATWISANILWLINKGHPELLQCLEMLIPKITGSYDAVGVISSMLGTMYPNKSFGPIYWVLSKFVNDPDGAYLEARSLSERLYVSKLTRLVDWLTPNFIKNYLAFPYRQQMLKYIEQLIPQVTDASFAEALLKDLALIAIYHPEVVPFMEQLIMHLNSYHVLIIADFLTNSKVYRPYFEPLVEQLLIKIDESDQKAKYTEQLRLRKLGQ